MSSSRAYLLEEVPSDELLGDAVLHQKNVWLGSCRSVRITSAVVRRKFYLNAAAICKIARMGDEVFDDLSDPHRITHDLAVH